MKTIQELITEHPFFEGLQAEHVRILAAGAREQVAEGGEVLFRQGEPANRFYVLVTGRVAVEELQPDGTARRVETLGAGDALGWSWLFPPFSWHFQARALEVTRVIVFDGGHLLVTAEEDHEFGYQLLRRVSRVVIRRLQATRQQFFGSRQASMTR